MKEALLPRPPWPFGTRKEVVVSYAATVQRRGRTVPVLHVVEASTREEFGLIDNGGETARVADRGIIVFQPDCPPDPSGYWQFVPLTSTDPNP